MTKPAADSPYSVLARSPELESSPAAASWLTAHAEPCSGSNLVVKRWVLLALGFILAFAGSCHLG